MGGIYGLFCGLLLALSISRLRIAGCFGPEAPEPRGHRRSGSRRQGTARGDRVERFSRMAYRIAPEVKRGQGWSCLPDPNGPDRPRARRCSTLETVRVTLPGGCSLGGGDRQRMRPDLHLAVRGAPFPAETAEPGIPGTTSWYTGLVMRPPPPNYGVDRTRAGS